MPFGGYGAERHAAIAASHLAENEFRAGHIDRALELDNGTLQTMLELRNRRIVNRVNVARLLSNLAVFLIACDRCEEAAIYAREALGLAQEEKSSGVIT
jgi:hypothetical protein